MSRAGDLQRLRTALDNGGHQGSTNAVRAAYMAELVGVAVSVLADDVAQYLLSQDNGLAGASRRTPLGMLEEFSSNGTLDGVAPPGVTAIEARQSGARAIWYALSLGADGMRFQITDPIIQDLFTNLGNDGGNGPDIFTNAQLTAIQNLATVQEPRWRVEAQWDRPPTEADCGEAYA